MSSYSTQSYFFSQKKRGFVRRNKKPLDTVSILGEKREPVLSFRPQGLSKGDRGEEGRNTLRNRRPLSSVSRHSARLPPIDKTGPHLTTTNTNNTTGQVHTNTNLSERKQSILQSFEAPLTLEEQIPINQPRYKFNEIKIASTGILFNLAHRFASINTEVNLPESLVTIIVSNFTQLSSDAIVDKREWQTDCYLDYKPRPSQTKESSLKVKIGGANMSEKERPQTAKSTASGVSIRSDVSHGSSHDGEYDKLPAELRTHVPQILRYKRETLAPPTNGGVSGPKTRLEKFQTMKQKAYEEKRKKVKPKLNLLLRTRSDVSKDDSEQEIITSGPRSINFSLASKTCADQGWIVHPSRSQDPEAYTLQQWATGRIIEVMRQREEYKLTAKLRGEDGPLVIRYYSDSHTRSLRGGRHLKASSLPLPTILSKLPPSLTTFTTSSNNTEDVLYPGENLCLLQLPDATGQCNYYSGRCAITITRKGDGSRGLYTLVYDDNDTNSLLAYFMPSGYSATYHRNGSIHMLTDTKGGKLLDEDGYLIREWEWPTLPIRMSQSVVIQLNTHLVVQCTGKTEVTLKFSCHGQMHRFSVGAVIEDQVKQDESFWIKKTGAITNTLQTINFNFQSKAAKDATLTVSQDCLDTIATANSNNKVELKKGQGEAGTSKPQSRDSIKGSVNKRDQKGKVRDELMESSSSTLNWDNSNRELEDYRIIINNIVSDWLKHYRLSIGITTPHHSHGSSHQLMSSIRSRQGSRPQTRPSTRPTSRLLLYSQSSMELLPLDESTCSRVDSPLHDTPPLSPPCIPSPIIINDIIERPKSHDQPRPFKAGKAKPRPRPQVRNTRQGCPIALHEMLVQKLTEMPQCKCDKCRLPLVRDLEFDLLMTSHLSPDQLIVICVTDSSSLIPIICEPMLESINYSYNSNRCHPCQQSLGDPFKIFKYDLTHSCDDLNSNQPLLVSRHQVKPGMFLFYMGHKLIGACTGFNGYGTSKRDFMKQLQQSSEAGRKKQYLPSDFKFSDSLLTGKVHSHSLWAYPITGVLDELVSVTPSSATSSKTSLMLTYSDESSLYGHEKMDNNKALGSKLIFKKAY